MPGETAVQGSICPVSGVLASRGCFLGPSFGELVGSNVGVCFGSLTHTGDAGLVSR